MVTMDEPDDLDKLIDSTGNSLFDNVLRISLFIGAIFQIICIFAVIFIPSSPDEEKEDRDDNSSADTSKSHGSSFDHQKSAVSHGRAAKKHLKKKNK